MILICSTPTTPTVGFMACVRACLEMCVCVCVCFALVCCALRVDFIKSLRLTNTVIIIIISCKEQKWSHTSNKRLPNVNYLPLLSYTCVRPNLYMASIDQVHWSTS